MKRLFTLLTITAFISCKKSTVVTPVEIFLLKSSTQLPGKCQIDPSTAILADNPVVYNHDIKAYARGTYEFTVTDSAVQKIASISIRTPFAVTVNKEVVYYGIYSPPIYSSSCDHSVGINVFNAGTKKLQMVLGYPGFLAGTTVITDQRNNSVILDALRNQGKLR